MGASLARPGRPVLPVSRLIVELESYELVLLRRPPDPPAYDEETLDRLQREHLGYLAGLRASGEIATNGPVMDQPDQSLRGLAFYRTGSLARARELAEADPAVRAGRLNVEVMTWLCPPGSLRSAGNLITLPDD
jgi:uncharacterized protein YciI